MRYLWVSTGLVKHSRIRVRKTFPFAHKVNLSYSNPWIYIISLKHCQIKNESHIFFLLKFIHPCLTVCNIIINLFLLLTPALHALLCESLIISYHLFSHISRPLPTSTLFCICIFPQLFVNIYFIYYVLKQTFHVKSGADISFSCYL